MKSRSRDAVLERLGLVSVSSKSGKVSVSVSSRTENRNSRSRASTSRFGIPRCFRRPHYSAALNLTANPCDFTMLKKLLQRCSEHKNGERHGAKDHVTPCHNIISSSYDIFSLKKNGHDWLSIKVHGLLTFQRGQLCGIHKLVWFCGQKCSFDVVGDDGCN